MRDCLIFGSGRSGTSLMGGILQDTGYWTGHELNPPTPSNPKGFFEDTTVEDINLTLLGMVRPDMAKGHRWLAEIPPTTTIVPPRPLSRRIKTFLASAPGAFALKDPSFSYTFNAWVPHLKRDAVAVCVFREPARTAHSIMKECQDASYLRDLPMDFSRAVRIWTAMYRYILEVHYAGWPHWIFVHYDQLLDGSAGPKLSTILGTLVDLSFADAALKRSPLGTDDPGATAMVTYNKLCRLAGYTSPVLQ
jgi:hypothetical protein